LKKEHILIPEPSSKFQKVSCNECKEENIVYSHASSEITCKSCGNVIAEPTGAVANIHGKVLGSVE
jgi:small subunit ribosomal protein S27e